MELIVIAGQDVCSRMREARAALPKIGEPGWHPELLTNLQIREARRGLVGAEMVKSMYGWSLRYNSGLQNFGLIAGSRSGQLNGTWEDCERYAKEWQAQDPLHRYVTAYKE